MFDEVQWKYDEVECDADFGDHEFIKPDPEISDMGNNNTECGIKMKEMALYQSGKYQCKFQKCNIEENNMCKTKISKDCKLFSATINLKVKMSKNEISKFLLFMYFNQYLNKYFFT